jgi:hypothetical protein
MEHDLQAVRITEEAVFRKKFLEHPESKAFLSSQKGTVVSVQDVFQSRLKSSVELTEKSHPEIFKLLDELRATFKIAEPIRLLKLKEEGGFESATICGDKTLILIEFRAGT